MQATTPADHGPWTIAEVAQATAAHDPAGRVGTALLHRLLDGSCTTADPTQLEALAAVFGVPPAYLTGTDEQVDAIDAELELAQAIRDTGVRSILLCHRGGAQTDAQTDARSTTSTNRALTRLITQGAAAAGTADAGPPHEGPSTPAHPG